ISRDCGDDSNTGRKEAEGIPEASLRDSHCAVPPGAGVARPVEKSLGRSPGSTHFCWLLHCGARSFTRLFARVNVVASGKPGQLRSRINARHKGEAYGAAAIPAAN